MPKPLLHSRSDSSSAAPVANATYSLSSIGSDGSMLQVDFYLNTDRFEHAIKRLGADGLCQASWTSVLQSDSPDWPASPPIQELSLESIAGRDVLLGVGRAGKSHWSISIETANLDSEPTLIFDIACRCTAPPTWLGSNYLVDPRASLPGVPHSFLTVNCDENSGLIQSGADFRRIEPTQRPERWPATIRWRYSVS